MLKVMFAHVQFRINFTNIFKMIWVLCSENLENNVLDDLKLAKITIQLKICFIRDHLFDFFIEGKYH